MSPAPLPADPIVNITIEPYDAPDGTEKWRFSILGPVIGEAGGDEYATPEEAKQQAEKFAKKLHRKANKAKDPRTNSYTFDPTA